MESPVQVQKTGYLYAIQKNRPQALNVLSFELTSPFKALFLVLLNSQALQLFGGQSC